MIEDDVATRVAILVACHNDGHTIGETIASVRAEPGAEVILVDDGSNDQRTLKALADLERDGIRVVRQPNRGPSAAWMTGLGATTSPYVMPFSSDDVLLPGATGLLADALDAHASAGFAWGDVQTFGLANAHRPSAPRLCPWLVTFANCLPPYSLFRRSLLLEVGGWANVAASEDWDLWMTLAACGAHGVYVPRPIYRYRRGPGGRFRRRGSQYEPYYAELQERHPDLFARRRENRRTSDAPRALKAILSVIEAAPRVPRLKKMQISEAFTLLFWSGGLSTTMRIVIEGLAFRARVLAHSRRRQSRRRGA